MAKRTVKEKEILDHLQGEGFKEIKEAEKLAEWYKKATERPSCLRAVQKKKTKS
jgi:hypothetical protein